MKKGKVVLSVIVILILAVAMYASVNYETSDTKCYDCGGDGLVDSIACEDCEEGLVDGRECTVCHGVGELHRENSSECESCGATGKVETENGNYGKFVSLIPAILAIVLALITKEVYSSLFLGIVLGGLISANFSPVTAFDNLLNNGIISAVSGTAGIFIFLVVLGIIVALVNKAGGSAAFGKWAQTHIKSRGGAMFATFVLGVLIFIDDYFNCLTV